MEQNMATHAGENEPLILCREEEGVAFVTLNRPKQFNALSDELLADFQAALNRLASNDDLRCVVIEGAGTAFCAGHDLKRMRANPSKNYYEGLFERCSAVMQSVSALPVPVVARVHGLATAAGCQLVAACDMAIASESAKFAVSGINVGLFCSTPAVPLSRAVNPKRAFEMLVTGRFVSAREAEAIGLVSRVVPDQDLDAEVRAMTTEIGAKSGAAIRLGKAMFAKQRSMSLADAYAYAGEVMACNMMTEDAGEGIDAFIQKRKPVWKHR
jgi:enoyl-CoA hydratase/carnithine racemase